jgi:hypothetical protein
MRLLAVWMGVLALTGEVYAQVANSFSSPSQDVVNLAQGPGYQTLTQWQTNYGQDLHSTS